MMHKLIFDMDRVLGPPPKAEGHERQQRPELTPEPELRETPAPEAKPPGGDAKVQKLSKRLRALGGEHPEETPTLKAMIKACERYPQELAVILEKAREGANRRPDSETSRPQIRRPAS